MSLASFNQAVADLKAMGSPDGFLAGTDMDDWPEPLKRIQQLVRSHPELCNTEEFFQFSKDYRRLFVRPA